MDKLVVIMQDGGPLTKEGDHYAIRNEYITVAQEIAKGPQKGPHNHTVAAFRFNHLGTLLEGTCYLGDL